MSHLPKHIKIKTAQRRVLVKRNHFLRNYPETKSYKPLCKKLQSNNNSLAKALSKQKQECQMLFSQNVALIAEVQDISVACSKRDTVISNVLKNAKEMLKMLVTMTGYLTNTISSCQEFTNAAISNPRLSCNSVGRRDSYRRLSAKSPTRGVVKPMVSGHTITKPTINLSRVNMHNINNPSNLSIIPEVATPPRNQELNNSSRSPSATSLRQRRAEGGRACRMPERLTVSQRESDENERRLSDRRSSRHSGRMSGWILKSKARLSRSSSRYSIENFEHIGSPRVKLNDVSKLLQNSQSINIRMLTENLSSQGTNSSESGDGLNQEDPQVGVIPETPPSDDSNNDSNKSIENTTEQSNNEIDAIDQEEGANVNGTKHRMSNWEDPLEGPSWLLNNSQDVPSYRSQNKEIDDIDVSNEDASMMSSRSVEQNSILISEENAHQVSPQSISSNRTSHTNSYESNEQVNESECSMLEQSKDDTFYNTSTAAAFSESNKNQHKVEHAPRTANLVNFVTHRRGCFESEDEDDFTLMYARRPLNMHFDINDLKLPVLEQSALKPTVSVEPEPEVTTTLQKISQICPIPSVSRNTMDESTFNQSTVRLPLLLNNDYENKELTSFNKQKEEPMQRKKKVKSTLRKSVNFVLDTSANRKKNSHKREKGKVVKDPSAVKVVLEKLNEFDVKSRTPSPDEPVPRDANFISSPVSSRIDNSSDSDSNVSSNSACTMNRPRRKRAPTSLHEPNLKKKLRRNT